MDVGLSEPQIDLFRVSVLLAFPYTPQFLAGSRQLEICCVDQFDTFTSFKLKPHDLPHGTEVRFDALTREHSEPVALFVLDENPVALARHCAAPFPTILAYLSSILDQCNMPAATDVSADRRIG
jgi:hypothetical protein